MSIRERLLDLLVGQGFDLAMRLNHRRYWAPLVKAAERPQHAQSDVLHRILQQNAATTFGREHGFDQLVDAAAFRRAVPVQGYESLRSYIDEQERTGAPMLTAEPPVLYAQTSGTSGIPKYLPITAAGITRVSRTQRLFAANVHRGTDMFAGKIVGIGSPAIEGTLPGGSPFGSASGLVYEGMPSLVRRKYVLSPEVLAIEDQETRYLVIAALCLAERNVTGVATANPSTLLRLRSVMVDAFDDLVEGVETGRLSALDALPPATRAAVSNDLRPDGERATELRSLFRRHGPDLGYDHIWPRLAAITTWTGGSCGFALGALDRYLAPTTRIVELGYSASEMRGSTGIDPETNLCLPLLEDNWFEFVERERRDADPDTVGPSDFLGLESLVVGAQYYVYVTTFDGLYRYDMNDIVEVTGCFRATPTIAFVQKGRGVTNITGEKLSENQVLDAVDLARRQTGITVDFFIALASEPSSQYRLYLETDASPEDVETFAELVDRSLQASNIEYRSKRSSGRLGPIVGLTVKRGTGWCYRADRVADGQRDAQFKYLHVQYHHQCPFPFDDHLTAAEPA